MGREGEGGKGQLGTGHGRSKAENAESARNYKRFG